jgi:hypothetical protein
MAITYVNSTGTKNNSTTALAVTVPTGGGVGDVLVFGLTNFWPQPWSTPTGLTLGLVCRMQGVVVYVYYRVVQSGDPTSYTFNQSSATKAVGVCVRYSGVDQTNPIRFWSAGQSNPDAAQTSVQIPAVQNVGATDLNLAFVGAGSSANNVTTLIGAPATWTSRQSLTQNAVSSKSVAGAVLEKAAATDTPSATGFSGYFLAYNVVLADASNPPSAATRTAPVFQTASTAARSGTTGTSLSINAPSGVTDGDLLIACTAAGFSNTFTMTGSWTPLFSNSPAFDNSGILDISSKLWMRIASGEPASYTVGIGTAAELSAFILRYSNVDTSLPFRIVNATGLTTVGTTSPAAPSMMPGLQGNELIVDIFTAGTDSSAISSVTLTLPGGSWTTRANVSTTITNSFQTACGAVEQFAAADYPTATINTNSGFAVYSLAIVGVPVTNTFANADVASASGAPPTASDTISIYMPIGGV